MAGPAPNAFYDALKKQYEEKAAAQPAPGAGSGLPPDLNPIRLGTVASEAEAAWRKAQARMEADRPLLDRAVGTAQAAIGGAGQGIIGTAGLPADISNLARTYGPAVGSWLYNLPGAAAGTADPNKAFMSEVEKARAGMTPDELAGRTGNVFGMNLPTGEAVVQGAREAGVPFINYQPQNDWERGVMDVSKYTGAALAGLPVGGAAGLVGGGLRGAVAGTRVAAGEILPATLAGLTAQGGKGFTEATGLKGTIPGAAIEFASELPGYVMGKAVTKGPWSSAAKSAATSLADPVVAGQLRDPEIARLAKEAALKAAQRPYYEGLTPRAADVIPELRPVQAAVEKFADLPEKSPLHEVGVKARENNTARLAELRNMGAHLDEEIDLALPFYAEPKAIPSTIDTASSAAGKFQQRIKDVEANENQLWSNPAMAAAEYDATSARNAFENVDPSIRSELNVAEDYFRNKISPNGTLSASQLKLIRSDIGAKLGAAPSGSIEQSELKKLYDALSNNLFDDKNLTPTSAQWISGAGVGDAFRAAVDATRTKHEIFGDPDTILGGLSSRNKAGEFGSPQDFMDLLTRGDINTNLRDLRRAGVNIDAEVKDYVLGGLLSENSGQLTRLNETVLRRFMADDRNKILIENVPGLKDELTALAGLTAKDRIRMDLSNVLGSVDQKPAALSGFIRSNRDELDKAFTSPDQQELLDGMQNSAALFEGVKSGTIKMNDPAFLNALKERPIFSMLYGQLAALPIGTLTQAVNIFPSIAAFKNFGFLPAMNVAADPIKTFDVLYNKSRAHAGQALLDILSDPSKAALLAGQPTPEKMNKLNEFFKDSLKAAGKLGAISYVGQQDYAPELPQPPDFYENARKAEWERYYEQNPGERPASGSMFAGGRIGRRSGGRVGNPGSAADKMIRAAEQAKNRHSDGTSPLLDVPDEAITKALAIANEKI
jgi:hypothetical protein